MRRFVSLFSSRLRDERGQVLPLVVIFMVVLIGFSGFAIDMARVWSTKQALQRSVDAAALAASQDLPNTSNAYNDAISYAANGAKDPVGGASSPAVTFECVSHAPDYTAASTPTSTPSCLTDSSGKNCQPSTIVPQPAGVTTCNAVNVTETATVKTSLLGVWTPSFTVKASSTAGARGAGVPNPMNVYVILDTSGSMGPPGAPSGDPYCTASVTGINAPYQPSKLDCAKAGVRSMLQALDPCNTSSSSCGSDVTGTTNVKNPVDEVGMVVFPAIAMPLNGNNCTTDKHGVQSCSSYTLASAVSSTNLSYETDCNENDTFQDTYPPYTPWTYQTNSTDGIPAGQFSPYSSSSPSIDDFPGYEAIPLSSDYRSSDFSTALNTSSNIVKSVYWAQCSGGNYPGGDWYGLKDITELANIHEGSYLAGAITEAQYLLSQTPARTGPNGQAVTNAIVILSDGGMDQPDSSIDGVDPGANGNVTWSDTKPCYNAEQAAAQAKAAGTLIYSIAYDSKGNCTDGRGGINVSATSLMQNLSSSGDYYDASGEGDLTSIFGEVGTQLSGDSSLIPDCTKAAPAC